MAFIPSWTHVRDITPFGEDLSEAPAQPQQNPHQTMAHHDPGRDHQLVHEINAIRAQAIPELNNSFDASTARTMAYINELESENNELHHRMQLYNADIDRTASLYERRLESRTLEGSSKVDELLRYLMDLAEDAYPHVNASYLDSSPISKSRTPCDDYAGGACAAEDKCPFSHDPVDYAAAYLRLTQRFPNSIGEEPHRVDVSVKRPCMPFFAQTAGGCGNAEEGSHCPHGCTHDPKELHLLVAKFFRRGNSRFPLDVLAALLQRSPVKEEETETGEKSGKP